MEPESSLPYSQVPATCPYRSDNHTKQNKMHTGSRKNFLMLNLIVDEVITKLRRIKILSSETVSTTGTCEMLFGFYFSKRKLRLGTLRNKISTTKNVNIQQRRINKVNERNNNFD
jgi:hypothetical protein